MILTNLWYFHIESRSRLINLSWSQLGLIWSHRLLISPEVSYVVTHMRLDISSKYPVAGSIFNKIGIFRYVDIHNFVYRLDCQTALLQVESNLGHNYGSSFKLFVHDFFLYLRIGGRHHLLISIYLSESSFGWDFRGPHLVPN